MTHPNPNIDDMIGRDRSRAAQQRIGELVTAAIYFAETWSSNQPYEDALSALLVAAGFNNAAAKVGGNAAQSKHRDRAEELLAPNNAGAADNAAAADVTCQTCTKRGGICDSCIARWNAVCERMGCDDDPFDGGE